MYIFYNIKFDLNIFHSNTGSYVNSGLQLYNSLIHDKDYTFDFLYEIKKNIEAYSH